MTPDENMTQIMQQFSAELLAREKTVSWLGRQMDISDQALGRIIYGGNKTGCSLSNAAIVANFLGYELQLVKQPPSPASRGVSPHENDSNHVSN